MMNPENLIQAFNMLQDTITFYGKNTNRRCIDKEGNCTYTPPKFKQRFTSGCAIGRYISVKLALSMDKCGSIKSVCHNDPEIYQKLPKWMKDMGVKFLEDIQDLHDSPHYWKPKKGMTKSGIREVKRICEQYKLDYKQITFPNN